MGRRLSELVEARFGSLTDLQARSYSAIYSGRNALIIAPTGFGKTEAALLPIFEKLINEVHEPISTLYITPLKALNRDLIERISWWCSAIGISVSVRHGDTDRAERTRQAKKPHHLLITTPETLQAMLPAPKMGSHLRNVRYVIVDEIHELFPDKRGAQLSIALERLREKAGDFQRIGISATVGNAEELARFLCPHGKCEIISYDRSRQMDISVVMPKATEKDLALSNELFLDENATARLFLLNEMIKREKTLAFVNTRYMAEVLSSRLRILNEHIDVHHGSLSKEARLKTEKKFKESEIKGLIATSSLELGIDIGDVEHVVQYMSPRQAARLIQRVGRSGHRMEKTPKGTIIAGDVFDFLESCVIARRASKGLVEKESAMDFPLDVLAHQIAGILLEENSTTLERVFSTVKRSYIFRNLSYEKFLGVVKQLEAEGLVFLKGTEISRRAYTREYYYQNLSTIPSERKFRVMNAVSNRLVSLLDEDFAATLEIGTVFIVKGTPWRVLDMHGESVIVEPSDDITGAIPAWLGEELPVPFEVSQEVGALIGRIAPANSEEISTIAAEYHASADTFANAKKFVESQDPLPTDKRILVEVCDDAAIIHTFFGSRINETLGALFSVRISRLLGTSARFTADQNSIFLQFKGRLTQDMVRSLFRKENVDEDVRKYIAESRLLLYKFVHVAKLFGLMSEPKKVTKSLVEKFSQTLVYEETVRTVLHSYFDVRGTTEILGKIDRGIELLTNFGKTTPFGDMVVAKAERFGELISPIEPSSEIVRMFAEELLEKTARMFCTYCNSIFYEKLRNLPSRIACPKCKSPLVAPIERNEKIDKKDKERWKELIRSAHLVEASGKRAVIALSTYGVGNDTAARILRYAHRDDSTFFAALLEAQKQFIRTKHYWQK